MRIQITKKLPKKFNRPRWKDGQVVEVTNDFGKELIKAKCAKRYDGPSKELPIVQRHLDDKK